MNWEEGRKGVVFIVLYFRRGLCVNFNGSKWSAPAIFGVSEFGRSEGVIEE